VQLFRVTNYRYSGFTAYSTCGLVGHREWQWFAQCTHSRHWLSALA